MVRTLQADSVPLETIHRLLEQGLARGGHARDVVLLPFDWRVGVLKDLLDRVCDFCSNAVSGDECDLLIDPIGSDSM